MFVARKDELNKINDALKRPGNAVLIYGKRRVGKTRLIQEALSTQKKPFVYYECKKGTIKENVDAFTKMLVEQKIVDFLPSFDNFGDVFAFMNTLSGEYVVAIDEYPYLSTFTDSQIVDSDFQNIIDNRLKNISLILSGSQISIMKDMLSEGNALYGRFETVIHLHELTYKEAAAFYPSKSPYEKVAFYSVFGGSPFVLNQLREDETLEQNIVRTILSDNNPVNLYASNMLLTDYVNAVNAERILAVIGNGKKKYSDIESKLFSSNNGNLAKQLKTLTSIELVRQVSPINKPNDAKKRYYEIDDNLIRFYYAYVYNNKSSLQMLGEQTFYNEMIADTLTKDFIPRRFEDICRSFFAGLARAGKLIGITNIGTYYYDDVKARKSGEFDVALEYKGEYEIYEAKFFKGPMQLDDIHRETEQIKGINEIKIRKLGFISINGFEKQEDGYSYYTGEDLYN